MVPRLRGLPKKYKISELRFRELYYYCLQYNEWERERDKHFPETKEYIQYSNRIKQIEEICKKTDMGLAPYIKEAVTNKNTTYNMLRAKTNIPCGKNLYYELRRKFYWILDKERR